MTTKTTMTSLDELTLTTGFNPNKILEVSTKLGLGSTKNFSADESSLIIDILTTVDSEEITVDQAIARFSKKNVVETEESNEGGDLAIAYQELGTGLLAQNQMLGQQLGSQAVDTLVQGVVVGATTRLQEAKDAMGKFMGTMTVQTQSKSFSPRPISAILEGSK